MLLEEAAGSTRPVAVAEPHFQVFEEFRDASYAKRYEILLTKLVRERLYDAASLILTPQSAARYGSFTEPYATLGNYALDKPLGRSYTSDNFIGERP